MTPSKLRPDETFERETFDDEQDKLWNDAILEIIASTTKGGPGSGHHGHRGRPGKRGGSLPGKGSKHTISAETAAKIRGYAERMGISGEKIIISDETLTFVVNGEEYKASMAYNPEKREIIVYNNEGLNEAPDKYLEAHIVHEVEHYIHSIVSEAGLEEFNELIRDGTILPEHMNPNEDYYNELRKTHPLAADFLKWNVYFPYELANGVGQFIAINRKFLDDPQHPMTYVANYWRSLKMASEMNPEGFISQLDEWYPATSEFLSFMAGQEFASTIAPSWILPSEGWKSVFPPIWVDYYESIKDALKHVPEKYKENRYIIVKAKRDKGVHQDNYKDIDYSNSYVHANTGEKYPETIPDIISIIVSKKDGDLVLSEEITASKGDDNYQSVLEDWMYRKGYVKVPDKITVKVRKRQ